MPYLGVTVLACLNALAGGVSTTWKNSTVGIHAFLTFDSLAANASIQHYADSIDYVWGASPQHVSAWRQSSNPDVVLSAYIPFNRDPIAPSHATPEPGSTGKTSGLPWWKANKPELVLYTCDRKTPAWECFAGEGCSHVFVPLDLKNPGTLEYQMASGVLPAAQHGYNAIAFDNYGLYNTWKACGSFSGPNGGWVQLYDGTATDTQYTADVLDWTERAVARIHAAGMLVIPNYSVIDLGNADVLRVTNLTDGILAEGGFTTWNPVPNSKYAHTPPPFTTPAKFAEQVQYIQNLQRYGKGYFAINEWGAGPDYGLNRAMIPYNITGDAHRAVRQFVSAAFMMVNGGTAGIYLTCIQCYGGRAGGAGNLSIWPEYAAEVGHPTEGLAALDSTTGVWMRAYSSGLALVNPAATDERAELPTTGAGKCGWTTLYDTKQVLSGAVTLSPSQGLVLLGAPC